MIGRMGKHSMTKFSGASRAVAVAAMIALLAGCGVIGGKKGGPKTPVIGKRTSILSNEQGVEVDPTLADVPVALPEPYANDQWSQPGGSPAKTMGNLALGASPSQAWTASISGSTPQARLASAPVVVGGKLYVIDADARVIAFDANSGAKLWQTPCPPRAAAAPCSAAASA